MFSFSLRVFGGLFTLNSNKLQTRMINLFLISTFHFLLSLDKSSHHFFMSIMYVDTLWKKISESRLIILEELYLYLNKNKFYDDPRTYLMSHTQLGDSKVIPIYDFEKMESEKEYFKQTKILLEGLFKNKLVSCHISSFSPGTNFRVYSKRRSKLQRGYIPLTLPHPKFSSGVWIKNEGVVHHIEGGWIVHPLNIQHSMFNYSSGDAVILIIDVEEI